MRCETTSFLCDATGCKLMKTVFGQDSSAYIDLLGDGQWSAERGGVNGPQHFCPDHRDKASR